MANAKPAAVIVNLQDGNIVMPTFYASKADEDGKKNPIKVALGAAMDRGVVGAAQPEHPINMYSFQRLKDHAIIKALVASRTIEFRAPNLVLDLNAT